MIVDESETAAALARRITAAPNHPLRENRLLRTLLEVGVCADPEDLEKLTEAEREHVAVWIDSVLAHQPIERPACLKSTPMDQIRVGEPVGVDSAGRARSLTTSQIDSGYRGPVGIALAVGTDWVEVLSYGTHQRTRILRGGSNE